LGQQTICIAEKTRLTPLILYPTVISTKHKEVHPSLTCSPFPKLDIDYTNMFCYAETMVVCTSLQ